VARPDPGIADPGPDALPSTPRPRLIAESIRISLSAGAFELVHALACRGAGLPPSKRSSKSVFLLAGASQFAVGLVMQEVAWPAILLLIRDATSSSPPSVARPSG